MHTDLVNNYKIIDATFLSKDECDDIYTKLLSIKNQWFLLDNIPSFYFYPPGMYSVPVEEYKKNLTHNLNLKSLFGSYYEKLQRAITNELKIPVEYHPNLNFPGFHISKGKGMTTTNFHRDGFKNLPLFLGSDKIYFLNPKIYSFVLPIKLTDPESGLLIKNKQSELPDILQYHEGALSAWDGDLVHSVKPMKENLENNIRITMQCHVAVSSKISYIFW